MQSHTVCWWSTFAVRIRRGTSGCKNKCYGLFKVHGNGTRIGRGNGTGTIGNNGCWSLSLRWTSLNIYWHLTFYWSLYRPRPRSRSVWISLKCFVPLPLSCVTWSYRPFTENNANASETENQATSSSRDGSKRHQMLLTLLSINVNQFVLMVLLESVLVWSLPAKWYQIQLNRAI